MTRAAAHGAIAVLAGLLLSTASAQAADLGGNCCADLEERVAELEATTARKGNRRMSLTVSGQVNRSILYWNDGDDSGTYAGLDNHNQSTRFVFSGSAKIRPDLTAGFEFMTEWASGARTSQVDQDTPDGVLAPGFRNTDGVLAVRTANWWLEDKHWGRVTVGRVNNGGPVGTIDLGGISTVAHFSPGLVGGAFFVGDTGLRLGALVGPTYGGDRMEGIRYDSRNLGGFVLQAAWGEDDIWTASVRYAGEHGGFRVAAGIGYQEQDGTLTQPIQLDTGPRNIDNEWSGSLAIMHVASGLFLQGHIAESEFTNGGEAEFWMIQGGISKNWFGMGNTSLYAEYGNAENYVSSISVIAGSDVDFYGLGVVQQIDAAAMELYLGWRRFDGDGTDGLGGTSSGELDLVHGGARIRF
jgi:hypothetical protein